MAAKATPKAMQLIQDEEQYVKHEELTKAEKVKVAWKCYIPAGILTLTSIVCTACGTKIGISRQAELISLVTAGENMYERYRKKVEDKFGKDADKEVLKEVAKDKAEELRNHHDSYYDGLPFKSSKYVGKNDLAIYDTGLGDELIWDYWNGRFLRCSETEILKAVATFNVDLTYGFGTFFPVSNFYDLIHAPAAESCNDHGYNQEYRLEVDLKWDDPEKKVYKIMTFVNPPKHELTLNTWR